MLYFGEPLFPTPPEACDIPYAKCAKHTFHLSEERARYIDSAVNAHVVACTDGERKQIDFVRFMAGPPDLDLLSPVEVFFTGYLLSHYKHLGIEWLNKVNPEHLMPPQIQEIMRRLRADGHHVILDTSGELSEAVREALRNFGKHDEGPKPEGN